MRAWTAGGTGLSFPFCQVGAGPRTALSEGFAVFTIYSFPRPILCNGYLIVNNFFLLIKQRNVQLPGEGRIHSHLLWPGSGDVTLATSKSPGSLDKPE